MAEEESKAEGAGERIRYGSTIYTTRDPRQRQAGASPATRRFLEQSGEPGEEEAEPNGDPNQGEPEPEEEIGE